MPALADKDVGSIDRHDAQLRASDHDLSEFWGSVAPCTMYYNGFVLGLDAGTARTDFERTAEPRAAHLLCFRIEACFTRNVLLFFCSWMSMNNLDSRSWIISTGSNLDFSRHESPYHM